MNTYRKWDWEIAKTKSNPTKINWFWNNHKKPITEEEFVKSLKEIRNFSLGNKKYKRYSPSNLRYLYRRLKRNYGFFTK
jgi:hypothetical protein